MTTEVTSTSRTIGINDSWLYKVAGILAFVVAILFIVDLGLYVYVGKQPTSGAAWLPYINGKSGAWWAIVTVGLVCDLCLLITNVTLYVALRPVHKGLALIATVWALLSIVLQETVVEPSLSTMLTLGGHYATATAAQRPADVAAASYGAAIISSRLDTVYFTVLPAVALVLICIVMLRSPFGRRVAYLGIVAGAFGVISISGWSLAVLLNTVLEAVWLVFVGRRLYFRYAAPAPVVPAETQAEAVSI